MNPQPAMNQFSSFESFAMHQQQHQMFQMDAEMEDDEMSVDAFRSENNLNFANIHQTTQQMQMTNTTDSPMNLVQQTQVLQQPGHITHGQQPFPLNAQQVNQAQMSSAKELLDKQVEEDDDDTVYEDDDEDDLDDFELDEVDEQMVQQMLMTASPENQQAIRLLLSGFSACASETIRYLIEEENMSPNSPTLMALVRHLKMQETILIVSCLRTQQMMAQQTTGSNTVSNPSNPAPASSKKHCPSTPPNLNEPPIQTSTPLAVTNGFSQTSFSREPQSTFAPINRQLFTNNAFNDSGFSEQ